MRSFSCFFLVLSSNRRILVNELPFGVIREDLMGVLLLLFPFFHVKFALADLSGT